MSDTFELFQRLSMAFAIGLLIGIERGWHQKDDSDGNRTVGLRTNGLAGLLGGVWGALAAATGPTGTIALAIAFVLFGGTVAAFRYREITAEGTFGVTTVIAAMLAFTLGAYAVLGDVVAAGAAAVAATMLLAAKPALHGFLGRLTVTELRSGLLLLAMTVILLPLLPDRTIDPLGAINPFRLWLLTILIAAISFAGYVAIKVVGERRGIIVTGLAGGLVSSTAVTLTMAKLAREHPERSAPLIAGALFASAVMAARVLVLVGVTAAGLVTAIAWPIGLCGLMLVAAAFVFLRTGPAAVAGQQPLVLGNPFDLLAVLKFGALLTVISVLAKVAIEFGTAGSTYLLAAVSGVADVDAMTLSMAQIGDTAGMRDLAATAILIVVASNMLAKVVLGWFGSGRQFGFRFAAATAAALAAGGVGLMIAISTKSP